jgi:uncharacterized protein with FMN-binding domain
VRRAILAVLTTAAGTTLLIGAKSGLFSGAATPLGATAPADPVTDGGAGPGGPSLVVPPGIGASPGLGASPGQESRTAAPRPTTGGPTTQSGWNAGTYTGTVAQTQWGPVQVRIVVAGGRLTDATAVQTPSSHSRSVQINRRATPILREEALVAQNAKIDTVSGATVTSDGYRRSLESALEAARHG